MHTVKVEKLNLMGTEIVIKRQTEVRIPRSRGEIKEQSRREHKPKSEPGSQRYT